MIFSKDKLVIFSLLSLLLLTITFSRSNAQAIDINTIKDMLRSFKDMSDDDLSTMLAFILNSFQTTIKQNLKPLTPVLKFIYNTPGILKLLTDSTVKGVRSGDKNCSVADGNITTVLPNCILEDRLINFADVLGKNFGNVSLPDVELNNQTFSLLMQLKYGEIIRAAVLIINPRSNFALSLDQQSDIEDLIRSVIQKVFSGENILDLVLGIIGGLIKKPATSIGCWTQMVEYGASIREGQLWALKMIDSSSKPPDGILEGRVKWVGAYDQCTEIQHKFTGASGVSTVEGGFYKIIIKPPQSLKDGLDQDMIKNMKEDDFQLVWGVCLPSVCTTNDVFNLSSVPLGWIESFIQLKILEVKKVEVDDLFSDPAATFAFYLTGLFIIFALTCTGYDIKLYYDHIQLKKRNKSKVKPLTNYLEMKPTEKVSNEMNGEVKAAFRESEEIDIYELPADAHVTHHTSTLKSKVIKVIKTVALSFSAFTNIRLLMRFSHNPNVLKPIYGLRTLCIQWILVGHTIALAVPVIGNSARGFKFTKRWSFEIVTNGTYLGCETFFVLSGIVTTYLFCRELDRQEGKIRPKQIVWYYVHRYLRLSPLFFIIIFYSMTLIKYGGRGPFWDETYKTLSACGNTGWYDIIYIHNFVRPEIDRCLPWTWYLACDMQFYVVAPLMIIPLYKFPKIGYAILGLVFAASVSTTAVLQYRYQVEDDWLFKDIEDEVYIKPWARIASYVIGVGTGYLLYRNKCKISMRAPVVLVGWVTASFFGVWVIFFRNIQNWEGIHWTKPLAATYETLSRPIWSFAMAWIVVACLSGYGGLMNMLLSWRFFAPFGRLTYAMFIAHPIIIALGVFNSRVPIYLSDFYMVYTYCGYLLMSWIFAALLSMAFEQPFRRMEKAFRGKDHFHID